MNKKAAIILLSASLAFVLATVLLLRGAETTNVLGSAQLNLSSLHKEGELYLAYIDNAAKFSLSETMKSTPVGSQDFYTLCKKNNPLCNDISQHFGPNFMKHLDSFNKVYGQGLYLKNYEFKSKIITINNQLGIELIGVSTDKIIIKKGEDIAYSVSPNFKIQASLEDLNNLATTAEIMAVSFLNGVVNKFQECSKQKEVTDCFCEKTGINPQELPEGYKVSIITIAEKEKLSERVEYKFKLFDPADKIVMRGRAEQIKTLKGIIIGAYEYVEGDVKNNFCYPGAFSKDKSYIFDKNSEKGQLYSFLGEANCKGVSTFNMVEFVKESDFGKINKPLCSEIGIKSP